MPSASGLVTAVFDGHTFTSPTVYLSFDYLSTELDLPLTANTSLSAPGVILTNVFVPIASASVSTIYWNDTDFYTASMDWSNFNAPVPYLAYNQGRVGWNGEISTSATIFPDDFAPYISLPSTIVNLVPEWSRCSLNDVGVWDPPHALQPAADPAQPVDTFTSTKFPVSTNSPGPAPGPSVGSFGPTSTDIPRPTPHPKSTANSPGIDPPIVPPANPAPVKSTAGSSPEIPDQSTGLVPPLGLGSSSLFGNGNGAALAPASNNGGSQVSETAINDDPGNEGAPSTPLASGADPGMSFGPSLGANSGTTGRSPAEIIASALGWSPDSGGSGSRPDSSGSGGDTLATEVPGQIGPSDGSQGLDPSNGEFGSGSNFEDDPASELAPQPLSSGSDARSGSRPEEVRFTLADGHSFTAVMVSHRPDLMNVDGQTLRIGGNAKAIDGSTFSAAPGGIVFVSGSQTSTIPLLPQATPAAPVIRGLATFTGIDSSILTASADSQNHNFVVGGRTISSGGPAFTVDGNIMSAGSDGLVVMHRTQTQVINFPSLPPEEAIFTALDGEMVTAYHAIGNNGAVVIDGHTLSVGGLAATLDGDTVSAIADGFVVIHGTQTQTLHFPSLTPGETIFTAPDGRIMTAYNDAANSGAVVVDGKPISVGGPAVTVNGETLSDGPSGLVVGDTIGKSTVAIQMSKPIFTAPDGRVMTASIGTANSAIVVIDGHILSVGGPAVTIDGETLSDGPSGLVVEDTMGRSTVALQTEKTPAATVPTATGSQTSNVDTMSTPLAANGAGGSLAWNITYIIVVVAVAAAISCR
ncbi:MAG: hypothetical protein M1820_010407 [Bogoriella megaspora]|nr:MAG: hypothetical protein M1820_010407 [Bogoriella megaspora]